MIIDQHTDLYGVLGKPIGHSLSPVMHNAAFSATAINAVYVAFETEDVDKAVQGIRGLCIKGMSVTIPLKSAVIPYLDDIDPMAERIGAVNTIVNDDGRLRGCNTDSSGALKALEKKTHISGKSCIIIGAGGAARAIGFALRERDVSVTVANRSLERGEDLARTLGCSHIPLNRIEVIKADILIQTTPVGMYPYIDQFPIPGEILDQGMVVMDIIYNPADTRLLKLARDRDCATVSGVDMFIHQGAEQFRLWTGIDPPLGVMRHAVNEALKKDERN